MTAIPISQRAVSRPSVIAKKIFNYVKEVVVHNYLNNIIIPK